MELRLSGERMIESGLTGLTKWCVGIEELMELGG